MQEPWQQSFVSFAPNMDSFCGSWFVEGMKYLIPRLGWGGLVQNHEKG